MLTLNVKKLSPLARLPSFGTEFSIGADLHAHLLDADGRASFHSIWPRDTVMIPTGISVAIPPGYYGRIAPKSGLAAKHGIDILAGVIDADYRGELLVLVHNTHTWNKVRIDHGQKIAQLILERADRPDIVEVDTLDETFRGARGFGSTGK